MNVFQILVDELIGPLALLFVWAFLMYFILTAIDIYIDEHK